MSRAAVTGRLLSELPLIAPSMLKCDFGNLAHEVERLESAGAQILHLDVMDGHFVPNLTYGPVVVEGFRRLTRLPLDAHLMISEPARYLPEYLKAGCDLITVHIETIAADPAPVLRQIRDGGAAAGIALNPGTPVEAIEPWLDLVGLVLVMSVEPGFGGQKFMPIALDKLRQLRPLVRPGTLLSVDGGINSATIGAAAEAGAQLFVAGSSVFEAPDYRDALQQLRDAASGTAGSALSE